MTEYERGKADGYQEAVRDLKGSSHHMIWVLTQLLTKARRLCFSPDARKINAKGRNDFLAGLENVVNKNIYVLTKAKTSNSKRPKMLPSYKELRKERKIIDGHPPFHSN